MCFVSEWHLDEATGLLLLPIVNCLLINNYQYKMRTKILCVQWPLASHSLTSELSALYGVV